MAIEELRIEGYRSIRRLRLRLGPVNVITGANGCGKTNLYRALLLLARAAQGQFSQAIAEEGGMTSVMWAGTKRGRGAQRMNLGVSVDEWSYDLACGLVAPGDCLEGLFEQDPAAKTETVFHQKGRKKTLFLERKQRSVVLRDRDCRMAQYPGGLQHYETALGTIRDPHRFPELGHLRNQLGGWRFYHQFRTDADAPIRRARVAVQTPVLSHDGADLAAALATIILTDPAATVDSYIERAFPGARLGLEGDASNLRVSLHTPGMARPLSAAELSDGTLRFLCLLAALLSPQPPALLALNEPETSLHPQVIKTLGELIVSAAARTQVWITTHSAPLAQAISEHAGEPPIALEMVNGATRVKGQGLLD